MRFPSAAYDAWKDGYYDLEDDDKPEVIEDEFITEE